jgi:hypothetical protein
VKTRESHDHARHLLCYKTNALNASVKLDLFTSDCQQHKGLLTMKFIEEHPLPSQKKRKVEGKKGEEERLLTVLWYDLHHKAARKPTGDLDDSD